MIDAYQERHQIASFSAAAETLVRLGLEQSPTEVLTPIVTSAVHAAIRQDTDRLIRLLLYAIMESGTASRLAGAALYRQRPADTPLKAWNKRYLEIKEHAQMDARRALAKPHIAALIEELYGDRQSQLSAAEPGTATTKAITRAAKYYTFRDGPDRAERQWHTSDGRTTSYEAIADELRAHARSHAYSYRVVVSTKEAALGPQDYHQALRDRFATYYFIQHGNTDFPHAHVIGFRDQRLSRAELQTL